jgi:hypothetical protein
MQHIVLYLLVELRVPEELMTAWQRSPNHGKDDAESDPPKSKLDVPLKFVGKEVDGINVRGAKCDEKGYYERNPNCKRKIGHSHHQIPEARGTTTSPQQLALPKEKDRRVRSVTSHTNVRNVGRLESCPWRRGTARCRSLVPAFTASDQTYNASDCEFQTYNAIFQQGMEEGIIEEVPEDERDKPSHYLPRRPVFKPDSLTTPVRPVFDASCKKGRAPSLNESLEKGPNLLELIPSILLQFKAKKVGVTLD